MAYRGGSRGRGRGGYNAPRLAKQVSFELFPEVENLGNAADVTERIALAIWQANLQKFWNSSPFYLADECDVLKKTKGMDIERFSDRKSESAKPKPPLKDIIRMGSDYVPAELAEGGRKMGDNTKVMRWTPESDMRKLDLLEKLDQKSKGDDEKKKDGEDEDEDPEKVEEEEEEFSDDGDYNQNLYDYDDDEDDYNMNEDNNDDAMY